MGLIKYNESEFTPMVIETASGDFTGLFTQFRLDYDTVPEGKYVYGLRHGDDDSYPCTIENRVTVNYYGSFITDNPIELSGSGKDSYLDIVDWRFTE